MSARARNRTTSAAAITGSHRSAVGWPNWKRPAWPKPWSKRGFMAWRRSGLSVYRTLLLAYPAEFRQEFGAEMERLAAARIATEPRTLVWLSLIADVAVSAPREHFQILARDLRHSLR